MSCNCFPKFKLILKRKDAPHGGVRIVILLFILQHGSPGFPSQRGMSCNRSGASVLGPQSPRKGARVVIAYRHKLCKKFEDAPCRGAGVVIDEHGAPNIINPDAPHRGAGVVI